MLQAKCSLLLLWAPGFQETNSRIQQVLETLPWWVSRNLLDLVAMCMYTSVPPFESIFPRCKITHSLPLCFCRRPTETFYFEVGSSVSACGLLMTQVFSRLGPHHQRFSRPKPLAITGSLRIFQVLFSLSLSLSLPSYHFTHSLTYYLCIRLPYFLFGFYVLVRLACLQQLPSALITIAAGGGVFTPEHDSAHNGFLFRLMRELETTVLRLSFLLPRNLWRYYSSFRTIVYCKGFYFFSFISN